MAILPSAQITFGDIIDDAFNTLKDSVDNLDSYTGNATNTYFNERTQTVSGSRTNTTNGSQSGLVRATLTLSFTGKPPVVTTAAFTTAWNKWLAANNFDDKRDQLITNTTLLQFLTALSM